MPDYCAGYLLDPSTLIPLVEAFNYKYQKPRRRYPEDLALALMGPLNEICHKNSRFREDTLVSISVDSETFRLLLPTHLEASISKKFRCTENDKDEKIFKKWIEIWEGKCSDEALQKVKSERKFATVRVPLGEYDAIVTERAEE